MVTGSYHFGMYSSQTQCQEMRSHNDTHFLSYAKSHSVVLIVRCQTFNHWQMQINKTYKYSLLSVHLLSQLQVFWHQNLNSFSTSAQYFLIRAAQEIRLDKQIQKHKGNLKMSYTTRWYAKCQVGLHCKLSVVF